MRTVRIAGWAVVLLFGAMNLWAAVGPSPVPAVIINYPAQLAPAGGGQFSVVMASDNLTDTDGTNLTAHTPTGVGQAWVDRDGIGATANKIIGNKYYAALSGDFWGMYVRGSTATDTTYSAFGTIEVPGTFATSAGVSLSMRPDENTAVWVKYAGGDWNLGKIVAGSATEGLGTFTGDDPTSPLEVELRREGTSYSVYIAGVLRIGPVTINDSNFDTALQCGIYNYFVDDNDNRTLDNFYCKD